MLALISFTLPACDQFAPQTCDGPRIVSPQKDCEAYYYKADYGDGYTAQAMILCRFGNHDLGGNIISYHNDIKSGIGFRWIANYELEVLLSPMIENFDQVVDTSRTAMYMGRRIVYHYRELDGNHPEIIGCIPG